MRYGIMEKVCAPVRDPGACGVDVEAVRVALERWFAVERPPPALPLGRCLFPAFPVFPLILVAFHVMQRHGESD